MLTYCMLISICVTMSLQNAPKLTVEQGELVGSQQRTWSGKVFSSFTGIPYAIPPVGKYRFKEPTPAPPWKGVYYANQSHSICPQMNAYQGVYDVTGNEDCLYLNVYTPQLQSSMHSERLPVMFYIHGGGWVSGSANSFGPKVLLDYDVILVTVNYRLGALGFLSTSDNVLPGNNGLKDQNLALKWVRQNIVFFGGDPNRITLFGQSAGAASVHFHLLSPLSRELITGAIMQSGTALAPWALGLPTLVQNNTRSLANLLHCPLSSSQELVNCLKKLPASKIVAQDIKFLEWMHHPMIPFKPVVEKNLPGSFIVEEPIETIKKNKVAKVPIMTGINTADGSFKVAYLFRNPKMIEYIDSSFNKYAPYLMIYFESNIDQDKLSEKVRHFYFGDQTIDSKVKSELTDMFTDVWFHLPAETTVRLHTQYTNQKVYYYLFGYCGSESYINIYKHEDDQFTYGVCHCDDLIYLFNTDAFPHYKPVARDLAVTKIVSSLWVNFAQTGNPTPSKNKIASVTWDPVKSRDHEYFSIKDDKDLTMQSKLNPGRVKFWKEVIFNDRWKIIRDEL